MKARVQVTRNNKTTSDRIWKDKKQFAQMSVRGCAADSIRLDIELNSISDVMTLINWCENSYICFRK